MHLVASTTVENFKLEGDIIQLNFLLKMSKQINPGPMSSHTALLFSLGSCCLLGFYPVPSFLPISRICGFTDWQLRFFFFSPVKWSNAKNTLNSNVDVTRQFHSNCFGRQFSSIRYYFLMLMLSDFIS